MDRNYHDPEWLEEQYHGEGRTQKDIADECGVSPRAVRTYMNKFCIETREMEGENHPQYGTERSEETRRKISETMQGREFTEEWRERIAEAQRGVELPLDVRRKISESLTGMSRPDQEGSSENWLSEDSWYGPDFRRAKRQIRRDLDSCANCVEDGSNYNLDVHHIVPIRFFAHDDTTPVTWAHQVGNLILLCRPCHKKAEHGGLKIAPNFQKIPVECRTDTLRLWFDYKLALMD